MRQSAREIETLGVQECAPKTTEVPWISPTPRMLIADDDPSIVRLLADHCARMGFDVDTASNGIQALLKASRMFW
jgi:PleD family two-component response regulator